jgi:2-dehydropantoate 2-reductase
LENLPKKRFLIFAIGAVGTYLGGSLSLSGQKVVYIARAGLADGFIKRGLRLKIEDRVHHFTHPEVMDKVEHALALNKYDFGILAIKPYDVQDFLMSITSHIIKLPPLICIQNGVENESIIAGVIGRDKVISGTVTTAVRRKEVGDVVLEKLRGVGLSSDNPQIPELINIMNASGLDAKYYRDPGAMKWSKMVINLLANASSAILDMTPREIFHHPELFRLELLQLREALRVMKSSKIGITDLHGTPVKLLNFIIKYFPLGLSKPLLSRAIGRAREEKMPSFHIDLHNGNTRSEVDYLNGAVVRFGKMQGIPTPVNQVLNKILQSLIQKEQRVDLFARNPDKLLNLIQ